MESKDFNFFAIINDSGFGTRANPIPIALKRDTWPSNKLLQKVIGSKQLTINDEDDTIPKIEAFVKIVKQG
jgi:hypothetical protein